MMASGDRPDAKQCSDMPSKEGKFRYKMNNKNRGTAWIINNVNFLDPELDTRDGSDRDVKCMREALETLKFDVIVHDDQSVRQMKGLFSDMKDHTENDCFVAVILTHGEDGDVIYGADGKTVTVDELIEYTLPYKCPSLLRKPKLFFVQACRGSKPDKGIEVHDSLKPKKIPLGADVLKCYSTVPGFVSWRHSDNGSWYMESLAHVLKNEGQNKEILELLTMVNAKVAEEYETEDIGDLNRLKQMPTMSSTLIRQLYF